MSATPSSRLFGVEPDPATRRLSAVDKMKHRESYGIAGAEQHGVAWVSQDHRQSFNWSVHSIGQLPRRTKNGKALLVSTCRFTTEHIPLLQACLQHPESLKRLLTSPGAEKELRSSYPRLGCGLFVEVR